MARKPNRLRERRRDNNLSRRSRVSARRAEVSTQVVERELIATAGTIPPDYEDTLLDLEARIGGLENP